MAKGRVAHPRDCGAHAGEHESRALASPDPSLSKVDLLVDDPEHVVFALMVLALSGG
jgi:hypothetical protein